MLPQLLADATRILGIDGQYGELEGVGWIVTITDSDTILVRHAEPHGRFAFEYDLGEVPRGQREKVYELLLSFNYLSPEFGGLRTAVSSASHAMLTVDIADEDVTPERVAAVIGMLTEKALDWRRLLGATRGPAPAAGEADAPAVTDHTVFV